MMKKMKFMQAFTMIELMTMMIVMMIIVGITVGVSSGAIRRARRAKAGSMIAALEAAVSMYHADTGQYPADGFAAMISALKTDPPIPGWKGPYIRFKVDDYLDKNPINNLIADPWRILYNYDEDPSWGNTTSYNLWSYGPNKADDSWDGGTPDTDYGDDIHNW